MTEPSLVAPPAGVVPVSLSARLNAAFRNVLVVASLAVLFAPPYLIPTSVFQLGLFSKWLALGMLALSVDLVWGYTGMLSLGQGLFFGLGAYCVAYSLKLKQAAMDKSDLTGQDFAPGTVPPDFMLYTGTASKDPKFVPPALEWIAPLQNIWVALAVAVLLPMLVALLFSLYTFRPRVRSLAQLIITYTLLAGGLIVPLIYFWWEPLSANPYVAIPLVFGLSTLLLCGLLTTGFRIQGVYFSLITQALLLAVFTLVRNQQRVTGGVVGIKNIMELQLPELKRLLINLFDWLGLQLADDLAEVDFTFDYGKLNVRKLYYLVAGVLLICLILCGLLVRTKFGRILTAIRDNENRVLALGYNTAMYKTFVFTVAAGLGGLAGALYVAANNLADPQYLSIGFSIEAVIWVAVGGRGNLLGAILGTVLVGWAYTFISSLFPEYWTIVLGSLFVLVVVFLPRGLVGKAGRGAFAAGLIAIIYVDAFVKWLLVYVDSFFTWAQESFPDLDLELTEKRIKVITCVSGCLFVLGVTLVPMIATKLLALFIRALTWGYGKMRNGRPRLPATA